MQGPPSHQAQQRLLDALHVTKVPNLKLVRVSGPTALGQVLYQPGLCLLAQGSKQLLLEDAHQAAPLPVGVDATFGIHTASTDDHLLDAVLRLCRLLETPRRIRQLAHFMTPGTQPHRIRLAAQQITLRYREPLRMEEQPPSGAPAA